MYVGIYPGWEFSPFPKGRRQRLTFDGPLREVGIHGAVLLSLLPNA